MIRGLYTAASGMMVQMEREDTIANNIANVNTTGYKKDQAVIKQFPEFDIYRKDDEKVVTPFEHKSKLSNIGSLGTGAILDDIYTEFTQGSNIKTDNKLDFAIEGEEFFAVEVEGDIRLQRNGNFSLNTEGYLVNSNGHRVLGHSENGRVGYIQINGNEFSTGRNGELLGAEVEGDIEEISGIARTDTQINKIMTVAVEDKANLNKIGDNYYSLEQVENAQIAEESKVHQGFLEHSTVNTVKEMVEMISCSRAYETNQKVLTTQNEMLGKAVNEVGKWT